MKKKKKTISIISLSAISMVLIAFLAVIINSLITFNLTKYFMRNYKMGANRTPGESFTNKPIFNEIVNNGKTLGDIVNSEIISNMFISLFIAMVIALIAGILISRFMSKSLKNTADMATSMQSGEEIKKPETSIREIQEVNNALTDFNARLKIKMTTRKSIIDQVTHESRTPLTILKSQIEAIEDGVIEPTAEEFDICKIQIDNLIKIIGDLDHILEANTDNFSLTVTKFKLDDLINQITSGLKTQYIKKNISLSVEGDGNAISLTTDRHVLSQCIMNVLTNAYKFTYKGGKVDVHYGILGSTAYIRVTDNGIGISDEDIENIFDPYFRSNSVSEIKGEGLGLYITKTNLNLLGGDITAESEVDIGTKIIITMPCVII